MINEILKIFELTINTVFSKKSFSFVLTLFLTLVKHALISLCFKFLSYVRV